MSARTTRRGRGRRQTANHAMLVLLQAVTETNREHRAEGWIRAWGAGEGHGLKTTGAGVPASPYAADPAKAPEPRPPRRGGTRGRRQSSKCAFLAVPAPPHRVGWRGTVSQRRTGSHANVTDSTSKSETPDVRPVKSRTAVDRGGPRWTTATGDRSGRVVSCVISAPSEAA